MNIKDYQIFTSTTAIYPKDKELEYLALGLASEAGEVSGVVKKIIRDNQGVVTEITRQKLLAELGDCCWYISQLASHLNVSIEDILTLNYQKLSERSHNNALSGSGETLAERKEINK